MVILNGGSDMKLINVVSDLSKLNGDHTIYATEPFSPDSEVIVTLEPESGELPTQAFSIGARYFIEVFIASDFIDDWSNSLSKLPSPEETCLRLIEYAEKDA